MVRLGGHGVVTALGGRDFALLEPFYDVHTLPAKYSAHKHRLRFQSVGGLRLGCRYLTLRTEATHAYTLVSLESIVRPSHLVCDQMRSDCFYEQDTSVYYA